MRDGKEFFGSDGEAISNKKLKNIQKSPKDYKNMLWSDETKAMNFADKNWDGFRVEPITVNESLLEAKTPRWNIKCSSLGKCI